MKLHDFPDIGHKPHIRFGKDGSIQRVGWPTALVYVPTEGPDAGKELPWPPTEVSHPGKPEPIPLSEAEVAREIAEGRIKPLPCSVPFSVVEKDLRACETLAATGWLYNPLHYGPRGEVTEKGARPMADDTKLIFVVALSKDQADRLCREAGLAPTDVDPTVRYLFDVHQLRGIEGAVLCMVGCYEDRKDFDALMEMAPERECEFAYSIEDAMRAAGIPFFLKQRMIDGRMVKEPELDGRRWLEMPEPRV